MIKAFIITILVGLFCFQLSAFGQELLFDGTINDYKTAVIKTEVKALFESQVFPAARKYFKTETNCEENLEINDGAAMQISTEKVYLYTYCGQPYDESYQGFVIILNGKVKAHYVFKTFDLYFTNIFYRHGLVIFLGEGTKFQGDWKAITTIDLTNTVAEMQRSFNAYSNECNDKGEKCVETARKIYAEFNDGYWFSVEEFKKRAGKWTKSKAKKDVTLDESENQLRLEDLKELK